LRGQHRVRAASRSERKIAQAQRVRWLLAAGFSLPNVPRHLGVSNFIEAKATNLRSSRHGVHDFAWDAHNTVWARSGAEKTPGYSLNGCRGRSCKLFRSCTNTTMHSAVSAGESASLESESSLGRA